ncbi:MAG: PIN domain-containing protein [Xanthobacteraceae bacterium]
MISKIVYLFPDTNLFVQCSPLEQLDWKLLGVFDEIRLLVSRPIQSEIDNQKNKGRDRLGDKARMTSKLFREIILDPDGQKVIEREKPLVTLSIRHEIRPSDEIVDRLDYRERDDQLIGIAYAFRGANPGADVRVLTNDTGPMASARMLGMEYIAVPNEWLLAPESTAAERRITALETQVARLRDAEPAFSIYFVDATGAPIERLEAEIVRYDPLGEGDVSELMSRIRSKFPLASHFGPAEPSSRSVSGLGFSRPRRISEVACRVRKQIAFFPRTPAARGRNTTLPFCCYERRCETWQGCSCQREGAGRFYDYASALSVGGGPRKGPSFSRTSEAPVDTARDLEIRRFVRTQCLPNARR